MKGLICKVELSKADTSGLALSVMFEDNGQSAMVMLPLEGIATDEKIREAASKQFVLALQHLYEQITEDSTDDSGETA